MPRHNNRPTRRNSTNNSLNALDYALRRRGWLRAPGVEEADFRYRLGDYIAEHVDPREEVRWGGSGGTYGRWWQSLVWMRGSIPLPLGVSVDDLSVMGMGLSPSDLIFAGGDRIGVNLATISSTVESRVRQRRGGGVISGTGSEQVKSGPRRAHHPRVVERVITDELDERSAEELSCREGYAREFQDDVEREDFDRELFGVEDSRRPGAPGSRPVGFLTGLDFVPCLEEYPLDPPMGVHGWKRFDAHAEQGRLWAARSRFALVLAGRRSGKTEIALRRVVLAAASYVSAEDGLFFMAAPTREQAYLIYWSRLKRMVPKFMVSGISETRLSVRLKTGVLIQLLGMDKPERGQGRAVDGAVLDEVQDMVPAAWYETVRPSLSTVGREGWAWLTGKPRAGRVHIRALMELASGGVATADSGSGEPKKASEVVDVGEWSFHRWTSASVIASEEVESARRSMDERTFRQEYEAELLSYSGLVYYTFTRERNMRRCTHLYEPELPLEIALDFNISPGVVAVCQTKPWMPDPKHPEKFPLGYPEVALHEKPAAVDLWMGEVWIPADSNTEKVCAEIIRRWGKHIGEVWLFGDASGGRGGTAQTRGSDWQIVKRMLGDHFGWDRIRLRIPKTNPAVVTRVNALCSRFCSTPTAKAPRGEVRGVVDPSCERILMDLEGVVWDPAREARTIEKDRDPMLTHLSDGMSYRASYRFGWEWKTRSVPLF